MTGMPRRSAAASLLPAFSPATRSVTFAVSRADRPFRSWLEKYELMELIDPGRFYPTNRHAAAG